jgi:hypothetical protein
VSSSLSLLVENTDPPILQKLGEGVPEVKRADNEQRSYGGSFRGGRGMGRGGRGFHRGGFANRGLSAAGLVGRGEAPKTNGDA